MKLHRSVLPVLSLALLIAAPPVTAQVTRTLRLELSAGESSQFAVENLAGSMKVRRGSGDAVVVIATVTAESDELAQEVRLEKVRGAKGVPTLRVIYPLSSHRTLRYPGAPERASGGGLWGRLFGGGDDGLRYGGTRANVSPSRGVLLYADVEVQVPARSVQATFRNLVGPLEARELEGSLRFEVSSGNVTLAKLHGDIVADTGTGNVEASEIEGSIAGTTGGGDCELSVIRGEKVRCDTGSGDIRLRSVHVSGEIRADTGSGDVRARDLEGSFVCDTGSGDCDVEDLRGGNVNCDTGSGNVRLRRITAERIESDTGSGDVVAIGIDAQEFEADTDSGDVSVEVSGDRMLKIVAGTGSGNVRVRLNPDATFELRANQGSGDLVCHYSDADPILEKKEIVGYRRGDRRIRIDVDTGSGSVTLEPSGEPRSARNSRD
ncbi:MAG: DUF4097 family beta strand repeat-containing protein [Acidobacteriota bacterium]